MYTDCRVKLFEVEVPKGKGKGYWKQVYRQLTDNGIKLSEWVEFLAKNRFKLKPVTDKSWRDWFQECQKPGYDRS
jgi:hypothetical protein